MTGKDLPEAVFPRAKFTGSVFCKKVFLCLLKTGLK